MLEAKTNLSKLVEAAERGEQVFLQRNGVPVAQIIPIKKRDLPFGFMEKEGKTIEDEIMFNSDDILEDMTRL